MVKSRKNIVFKNHCGREKRRAFNSGLHIKGKMRKSGREASRGYGRVRELKNYQKKNYQKWVGRVVHANAVRSRVC